MCCPCQIGSDGPEAFFVSPSIHVNKVTRLLEEWIFEAKTPSYPALRRIIRLIGTGVAYFSGILHPSAILAGVTMKLSVYLLRESVKSFEDALNSKSLTGNAAFKELKSRGRLPFTCKAYVQVNKSSTPKWEPFLGSAFSTSSLKLTNQSSSFVLLIKKQKRIFAVTFGYGFQAIDPAKIETRFGLMVAANWLTKVNGVETNVIDRVSSNKKFHLGEASDFAEFALNPQIDFIRRMEGKLPKNNTATKISGCDSCCITFKGDVDGLGSVCTELFDYYSDTNYKKAFGFLDNLQPLSKHDPRLPDLEQKLVERVQAKSFEKISIAFPEMPNEELLHHYKISCRATMLMEELTLEGIYKFLEETSVTADPAKIFVVGIGDNDNAVTRRRCLRDYLAAEFEKGEETFIFCNDEWFQAETNYVNKVRAEVAALADLTDELELPPMRNNETEGQYNDRVAKTNHLLHMDKDNFKIGSSHDKIEVCDLLSPECELICVKKMQKSSSMSHLFSQGSVSATLLRTEPKYRKNLNRYGKDEWPEFSEVNDGTITEATIVYAVATRKKLPLSEGMFFFSLVNLLNHVRTISLTGCKAALCKIEYEDSPSAPTKPQRAKKTKSKKKTTTV